MVNIIAQADYKRTWKQVNQNTHYPEVSDPHDFINFCPQNLGKGFHRWIHLRAMDLLIIDEEFYDDLYIESNHSGESQDNNIEFGFNLSGSYSQKKSGESFLHWVYTNDSSKIGDFIIFAKKRRLKVDIHIINPDLLKSFILKNSNKLPRILRDLLEGNSQQDFFESNIITPEMYLPLKQIINCPFQGMIKYIYLEGKCLELIAIKLDQLTQNQKPTTKSIVLKKEDIERIHAAKVILIKNINNPPSLMELAHQVGLNDYKLKIGFHQVFGTTAFGYLHQQRMEFSRQLLLERGMSIKEIARAVGYANQGCFAAAFRKRFGVNPKYYRLEKLALNQP
ncbi:helix-turn-helix transcriptional regulator [Umezakia ovalisporum]|uniref:helix-turn-helix transcriptional regulator n=1 Tax=Umezakia ovalisporum TaxID=75695 RepID=UPI0035BAAE72